MTTPNTPLAFRLEPSPGSDIGDCYDQAAEIVRRLGSCVVFEFNEVHCGVRPCDVRDWSREDPRDVFLRNFQRELAKTSGCKICYANP
jgi:hypothetical protein